MTDDSEKAELRKKIARAERRLWATRAEMAEFEQRVANFEKAEAALMKFYKRGPHSKKKSGRPSFWKSPHGCFFVWEVETILEERKCKIATAIRTAKKIQLNEASEARLAVIQILSSREPLGWRNSRMSNYKYDIKRLEGIGYSWSIPKRISEKKKPSNAISSKHFERWRSSRLKRTRKDPAHIGSVLLTNSRRTGASTFRKEFGFSVRNSVLAGLL